MHIPRCYRLLTLVLSSAVFGDVLGAQGPVGIFTAHADVGRARGSASYDPQRQAYLVAGSGQNMWDARDDFHFVWKRISGNFILSARVRFMGAGVEEHRKIGWTIRPSLDPGSMHVTAALHGNGLMSLQFRRQTGGITEEAKSRDSLPDADAVIQLERRDGDYYMSVAQFGDTLVTQRLTGVSLPDTVYVGLFVCAHNDTVTERAIFSNVRITTPAKRDFVPPDDHPFYQHVLLRLMPVAGGPARVIAYLCGGQGHDQRPVVGAGRYATGVREQLRNAVTAERYRLHSVCGRIPFVIIGRKATWNHLCFLPRS